jgi:hypothetical protein
MMDEYMDLYEAIWKLALKDDVQKQQVRMTKEILAEVLPYVCEYDKMADIKQAIKDNDDMDIYKKVVAEVKSHKEEIKTATQERLLRETKRWPDNPTRDAEYEKEYRGMFDYVLSEVVMWM